MKNPVTWFEIYVQDMDRAKRFYEAVLNIQMEDMIVPTELDEMNSFHMVSFPFDMNGPNISGALVKAEGIESGGTGTVVYFTCEDCKTEENRVHKAGGTILKEKFSIGEFGFCTICQDTEGNMIGLHSMK